ncbi:hypothetical protein [Natronococcus occultus]|uniref:C2H2-type domain-containing protein n=1 Tax=Natronococcus occultus SP4 TaxID=694430 RepID=L0JYC6_9EURY|nr:hypothetical protein [Natronococcus occultus]AGB38057.1 hypothetical protein Natoc_2279 [Natronococcus occultus SP4]
MKTNDITTTEDTHEVTCQFCGRTITAETIRDTVDAYRSHVYTHHT